MKNPASSHRIVSFAFRTWSFSWNGYYQYLCFWSQRFLHLKTSGTFARITYCIFHSAFHRLGVGITSALCNWKAAQNENLREFRYSTFSCLVFWDLCMNNSLMGKWKKRKGKSVRAFSYLVQSVEEGVFRTKPAPLSKYMHIHNSTGGKDKELYSWYLTFLQGFCNKHS